MQVIKNINDLRNQHLSLMNDILTDKFKLTGEAYERENVILKEVNNQTEIVLNTLQIEINYCKLSDKSRIEFLEY